MRGISKFISTQQNVSVNNVNGLRIFVFGFTYLHVLLYFGLPSSITVRYPMWSSTKITIYTPVTASATPVSPEKGRSAGMIPYSDLDQDAREGNKVRADNCRRADNYGGLGNYILIWWQGGITIGGREGVTGIIILQLWRIRGNRRGLSKRFVYLSN